MFSPFVSFLAGLLLFFPGHSNDQYSDILGIWEDYSVAGHHIEFFLEGDQLFASSSLFSSAKLNVSQQNGKLLMYDRSQVIEVEFSSDFLVINLKGENSVEEIRFAKTQHSSGQFTASNSRGPELDNAASLGMIKGFPVGKAKSTASIFRVFLFQGNQMISSQVLDSENGFVFSQLPNGRYTVFFEAQGPTAIQPVPAFKMISVQNGDVIEANVVLE